MYVTLLLLSLSVIIGEPLPELFVHSNVKPSVSAHARPQYYAAALLLGKPTYMSSPLLLLLCTTQHTQAQACLSLSVDRESGQTARTRCAEEGWTWSRGSTREPFISRSALLLCFFRVIFAASRGRNVFLCDAHHLLSRALITEKSTKQQQQTLVSHGHSKR